MLANCLFQIRQLCQLPRFIIYFIYFIYFFYSHCQKSFYVISVCHAFLRGCCIFCTPLPVFYTWGGGGLHSVHLLKRCIFVFFFWSLPVAILFVFSWGLWCAAKFFLFSLLYYREGLTYPVCRAKRLEIETPGLEKVIELVLSQQAFNSKEVEHLFNKLTNYEWFHP